jgi:sugar porter (SP) family MFS transporter
MNNRLFYYSIVVALAGFLFGFDTVVISGADKQLQGLWQSSDFFHGFVVMSMALWGTVLGAIFGNIPTDKLGRRPTLIYIGIFYFISAMGSALVSDPYLFSFFRFLGGLGVGASTIAAPAYVSEIAPAAKRGRLVALYQFNIVLGILVAFVSNFLLSNLGENSWRWMIGAEALPALIYTFMVFRIPESPRWLLLTKKDREAAKLIFQKIGTSSASGIEKSLDHMIEEARESTNDESLFDKKYRFPLMLAILIAFFNQMSGINAVLYYAPRIMNEAGLAGSTALLSSIGIGITNMVFTLVGLNLIDRLGRRTLMYIGSVSYIVSLLLVATAFFQGWSGMAVPIFLFMFIGAHAVGQGTVMWVFISEIFPNHLRAKGQSMGSSTHWVMAAIITIFMPPMLSGADNPGVIFLLFAGMMVLQLLFVRFMMPETKGVSLEDLQEKLSGRKQ